LLLDSCVDYKRLGGGSLTNFISLSLGSFKFRFALVLYPDLIVSCCLQARGGPLALGSAVEADNQENDRQYDHGYNKYRKSFHSSLLKSRFLKNPVLLNGKQ
jgi:hypothetical protein